jgi:hypothetical protein
MFSVSRGSGSLLAAFLTITAIVTAASGCSSTDAGPRLAANLGTRICIVNSWTESVNVTYGQKDTSTREGDIPAGSQSCAEGTKFNGTDVSGELALPDPALPFAFGATNPWVGEPSAWILQREDPSTGGYYTYHLCTSESGMDVGATRIWDNGTERITITRLGDDQWKEFTLVIEPSQGQRVGNDPCQGGSG